MSTYLYVENATGEDAPESIAFSSGLWAMPELCTEPYVHGYGAMPAQEFSELLEAAILRLYRSREWGQYVGSGARDAWQETLESGGLLVGGRGDLWFQEAALLEARGIVAYALERNLRVAWD